MQDTNDTRKDHPGLKVAGGLLLAGLLVAAGIGLAATTGDLPSTSRTTGTVTQPDSWAGSPEPGTARYSLCRTQERLLDQYIEDGRTDKMREYQRHLTENRCYG